MIQEINSIMKILFKHTRIYTFLLTLLLLGSMANHAWADVTYIILTKPFDVKRNGAGEGNFHNDIRLEALRCTSTGTTVYLPDAFRSPLATNFQYWKSATVTANQKLYDDTGTNPKVLQTTYDIYTGVTDPMAENSTLASHGDPTIIYVTYDYNDTNTILKLNGKQKYNVTLNTGDKLRFFAYNKNRSNRPAAAKGTTVSAEDLVSSVFTLNDGGFDGKKDAYYQFIFSGEDPYNITIGTAYSGNETFMEDLNVEKGKKYMKTYKGGTIFAKLDNNNDNNGTANMWLSPDAHKHYKSATAVEYDSWEGFYRSDMNPNFNAVALLPKGTSYFFVATKLNQNNTIYQPNSSGNYATLSDDGKNPRMIFKALSSAISTELYPIYTYTFKVKTPFGNYVDADIEWSDYYITTTLSSKVPEALRRKYTTFTGFYADAELTNAVTTFEEVQSKCSKDGGGKYLIYVKYTVNTMPFETVSAANEATAYTNATWYQMTDKDSSGKKIKWDSTNSVFKNNGGADDYSPETHYAFIGDPYELHIINRKLSEDNTGNRYVGSDSRSSGSDLTYDDDTDGAGFKWEIPYDAVSGNFTLREFKSSKEAYWKWNVSGEANNITYTEITGSATPTRIKVLELPKVEYIYHIINSAGNVAVKMTEAQDIGTSLSLKSIPELIRSPFLALPGVNIYYYWSKADYDADQSDVAGGGSRTRNKTNASFNPASEGYDIYVAYTGMETALASARVHFHTDQYFNVVLNGQYLYYSGGNINSKYPITDDEAGSDVYKWRLEGQDPYNMKVYNAGAYDADNSKAYINTTFADDQALTFDAEANAKSFVALSGTLDNSFEVMAATGETPDIAENYYHIGRKTDNTVKMYDNKEAHGYATIRFMLTLSTANVVTYHLVDKNKTDLLQVDSRYESLYFPSDYRSPLVARYHYFPTKADADNGTNELTANASISDLITANTLQDRGGTSYPDVYVTYDTGTDYDLQKKRTMYLLKFNDGDSFKQEDGGDGLTAAPVKAIYPYCNGDGNFFVYGQDEYELQQQGAASTRTRWAWYLESANNDPYHVKICSRQQETYPAGSDNNSNAYFRTYAETFGDGTNHVVTNLSWPGISGEAGTDYMVLGAVGQFRLVTSSTIPIDLNGDDDTTDEGENVRHTVNSFEQYWKTWNTIRLKVLGDEDAEAKQSDPNIVPATPAAPTAAAADVDNRTYLTDNMGWHCYEQWAYAIRWNDYNKAGDKNKKGWESLEHWFQTVNMGEGYFDLVPVNIDPVLILLDQHGWEIMRKALPNSPTDPDKDDKYNAIRPYDSPMVKEYYFWTKASKRSGYHQYYSLGQQIKVDGVAYTSTSLTDLPPFDATDVHDKKGNLLDQYVTYAVKDEYLKACDVKLTYSADSIADPADDKKKYIGVTATVTGVPFLIEQGNHFAYNNSDATAIGKYNVPDTGGMSQYIIDNISNLTESGSKNKELWYLKPNLNIDQEMGYDVTGNSAHEWASDYDRKDKVKTSGFNSWAFDPYNIQISSVFNTAKYFATNATGATLGEGDWTGTYSGDAEVSLGAAADPRKTATWYDSRTMAITNITFMAVQDESGNMQLMPRFDHTKRLKDFTSLTTSSEDTETHTTLYRPLVYNYQIIDNDGKESLRYQGGGDLVPQTPEWFKSQLAKDFKYYTGAMEYSTADAKEAAWTAAAEAYKKTATSEDNMKTQINALTASGTYYFKIEYYKQVSVTTASGDDDAVYTTTTSTESAYSGADEAKKKTATSDADLTKQAKALTSTGDFFFKIVYYKSVKFNVANGFSTDVRDKVDISNREITGSLAGTTLTDNTIFVRYSYDEDADVDKVLQGKWLTMTLNERNAIYNSGLKQASGEKPTPVNGDDKQWQWKFLATPQSTPDPYAVSLYNRNVGGAATEVNGKTKFALLNYYDNTGVNADKYTLAVAGTQSYNYAFVNGASMTTSVAATTAEEANVKSTSCSYTNKEAQVVLTDDVEHTFSYKIYTNGTNGSNAVKYGVFAVSADQDNATVVDNGYVPTLPDAIKSPLLNTDQFMYYGAEGDMGNSAKELTYLYGLYEDDVYVRYTAYDLKNTEYKVPNVRNATNVDPVAKGEGSNDASLDISGELIYNIIWYDDNMMKSDGTNIANTDDASIQNHALSGNAEHVWMFEGNDPYAIKIKHHSGKYAVGSSTLESVAANAKTFMLLPASDGWQYGVLQEAGTTGDAAGKKLTTVGNELTTNASTLPTRFIIFGLSTNHVIYHLVITNIGNTVNIPYRATKDEAVGTKSISGSTCRDLTTQTSGVAGDKYQLGGTINDVTYCVDQGHITLGDSLKVPEALKRPNCKYFYYVGGIYTDETCATPAISSDATPVTLDSKYKGLQVKYMGTDPDLLGKTVVINVVYAFDDGLPTNNGSNFVTNSDGTQWYTFETSGETPYLANYTYKDEKMKGKAGRIGHYTNEFLWSPVGDPYGFKMYNRYVYKNGNETTKVMTSASIAEDEYFVMGATASNAGRDIYELLPGYSDGYFKVQTLTVQGGTPYYVDNRLDEGHEGEMKLKTSTTTEWTFGLNDALLDPYYLGAGNVGGLTTTVKEGTSKEKSGKTLYEEATTLIAKQGVVFDADNIVDFTPGYYRIFSQPNSQGIKIPRYLSGYTHKTELVGDGGVHTSGPIPMHFYEQEGVTTSFDILGDGFTVTNATQGQIPIEAPEYDPASIFYISSAGGTAPYTMQTQGLYADGAVMASAAGTNSNFYVLDIGGAVVLLHDGAAAADRKYLHYKQTENIYDVKFDKGTVFNDDDAAKWCMEPANKKGLWIETHSGGEEAVLTNLWYYASYCVPFDLLISNKNDDPEHSSNAYTCVASESPWSADGLHPKPIGKYNTGTYKDNDYFVPAGTPVLFSTRRATEYIKATIPTNSPSTPISTIFSAKYLEQKLPDWNNANRVYVFGPKMEGTMSINTSNGDVNATLPSLGNTNVGFHINANQNKESNLTRTTWTRNNYYVLHNRIYYIANVAASAGAKAAEFVPLIFDFDEDIEEEEEMKAKPQTVEVSADKVYDVQGRCIAIGEDVLDGSWKNNVAPGLYIIGGKKVYVGK